MCHHRKTIYECNHTIVDPTPLRACEAQRDYESGSSSDPCDITDTHGRSNVKIPQLCKACHDKKSTLDSRLSQAKLLIEDLKKQLSESYSKCVSHVDDAGLESEKEETPPEVAEKEETTVEPVSTEAAPEEETERPDPVAEFLKKKMQESYAHLMMISDFK
ncbi:hypothetical protein F5Y11DRAFT_361005 [Daldinia sp. FL1419]|nr:hypothetical protein F5Y11DRAFT_361005 [Daldinia sp. FL1419]